MDEAMKARRDQARDLKDRIGWSWQKLGERLDLTPSQGLQLSTAKRPIADGDLMWLAEVAAAVEAIPHAAPANDTMEVIAVAGPLIHIGDTAALRDDVTISFAEQQRFGREREEMRSQTAHAIAEEYCAIDQTDWTTDQKAAAKHVLGSLAQRTEVVEAVKFHLQRLRYTPPEPSPRVSAWEMPTRTPRPAEEERQPF